MKQRTKLIIGLTAACAGCCIFAACSSDNSPYADFNGDGYCVTVFYDANGGQFASTSNVNTVDVYPLEQAVNGVTLIEPGSSERGDSDTVTLSTVSRSGYFLAGWYQTRSLRTDEDGNALDEDGNLCSASGKEQGYIYSGRWDFDTDKLYVESGYTYTEGEYTLTLYAAWVPYFTYTFCAESDGVWETYGSYTFNPTLSTSSMEVALPALDEDGVAMVYGNFLQVEGKTFTAAYNDEDKTDECEDVFVHQGTIDYEAGVSYGGIDYIYTEWIDGIWFNIYTVEQFSENARTDGCYTLYADLDFSETSWSAGLARGTYTGSIVGNGHTISNVTIIQSSNTQTTGGLFGAISASVTMTDVSFVNITYIVSVGSRLGSSNFGLFAGTIASGASFENVSVSGTLLLGDLYRTNDYATYNIGLLCSNYETVEGITYEISYGVYEEGFTGERQIDFVLNDGWWISIEAIQEES